MSCWIPGYGSPGLYPGMGVVLPEYGYSTRAGFLDSMAPVGAGVPGGAGGSGVMGGQTCEYDPYESWNCLKQLVKLQNACLNNLPVVLSRFS